MRAIIYFDKNTTDKFVNIEATKMQREDDLLFLYNNEDLVGFFDFGSIHMAYLSGSKEAK